MTRFVAPAAVLALGAALVALLVLSMRHGAPARDLSERCASVAAGDTADEVFARMGLEGYRPGCGSTVPCDHVDLGGLSAVPWLCDPDDCSLLWRAGEVGCFVDLDPGTRVVLEVVQMQAP